MGKVVKSKKAKPFLKWVGGKRQLLLLFEALYPMALKQGEIKNYADPFVGGGAVFFDVVQKYPIKSAHLFDVNEDLILVYRVVQRHVQRLMEALAQIFA